MEAHTIDRIDDTPLSPQDLAVKADEMTEAQRQHAECYKRLQQTNQKLELESEISKQVLCLKLVYSCVCGDY